MIRLWQPPDECRYLCSFGITEAIGAVIASAAISVGVPAAVASTVGTIGAGVVLGAGGGAALAGITGGNVGLGALTGAITGGLIPAGGIIGGDIGGATGAVIGDVLGGAAGGAIGAGITGTNPAIGALEGGAAGGISAALAPSTTGEPVPGGAGSTTGGVISPTAQEALASTAATDVAAGTAGAPTAAPTTAMGTLAGPPAGPPAAGGVPIPDALNLPPITGPASNVPGQIATAIPPGGSIPLAGEIPTGATGLDVSPDATQALSGAGTPGGAPTSTSPTPAATSLLSSGATPPPGTGLTAEQLLATPPGATTAGAGITSTATQGGTGGGGIGGFIKDNPAVLAAAPLALTLLRGEQSLPPQLTELQNKITSPLEGTAAGQLSLANKGELTPGAAASVSQYVQEATSALYQNLASSGVTNPTSDTRYIQGLGSIAQQASVMTQGFVQQEFNNAFQAAGEASGNLIAAANAQISEDNAFTAALSSAFTSAGLLFAFSGGLKSGATA